MSLTRLLITKETMREHRARWFEYTGNVVDGVRERIPCQRGMWGRCPAGYDVVCSCGFETRTGGGLHRAVEDELRDHRWSEQCAKEGPAQ